MKTFLIIINVASALSALGAAYYWWRVASEEIPDHMGLTFDQTDFDWLTVPLANQGKFNKRGAMFAAIAAFLQAIAILVHQVSP